MDQTERVELARHINRLNVTIDLLASLTHPSPEEQEFLLLSRLDHATSVRELKHEIHLADITRRWGL